ncbi:MAG: hypothetical protein KAS32_04325 [Candidatus Peribacteraceae bacterium]|nr:hypothetical protein [Candidatus Peribacteraceae bacterium]
MPKFYSTETMDDLYANLPDGLSAEMVTEEVLRSGGEIEGLNAEFSPGEMMSNVIPSTVNLTKDMWSAVKGLGSGLVEWEKAQFALLKGDTSKMKEFGATASQLFSLEVAGELKNAFMERYGTAERILNTIEKDPMGFLSDASMVVTGVGGVVKGAAATTAKIVGVTGKTALAKRIVKTSKYLDDIGEATIKVGNIMEPTVLLTETIPKATVTIIEKASSKFLNSSKVGRMYDSYWLGAGQKSTGIEPSQMREISDAVFTGEEAIKTLGKYGIHGTLPEMEQQALKLATRSRRQLDEGLQELHKKFTSTQQTNKLNKALTEILPEMEDFIDDIDILSDYRRLRKIQQKVDNGEGFTVWDTQQVKKAYDDYGPDPFTSKTQLAGPGIVSTVKDNVKAKRQAGIRRDLRAFIEDESFRQGFTDVKHHNDTIRFMTPMNKMLRGARVTFADRIDWADAVIFLAGVSGSILSTNITPLLGAVGVTGLRAYLKSPKFATAIANNIISRRGDQYEAIKRAIDTGQHTTESQKLFKEMMLDMSSAFPGIRIVGRAEQTIEETQQ